MSKGHSSIKAFPEEEPEFQVAPMIDILLVLMTFFMSITSTEVLKTKTKIANINLPVAENAQKMESKSEVVINVGWDAQKKGREGIIEFEEKPIDDPTQLIPIIQQRKQQMTALRAVIRASQEVPYSFIQQVMMACGDADVDNITFLALNKESEKKGY